MKVNNTNPYTTYNNNIDPNKKKKCSCEDKVGPKQFNSNSAQNNQKSKSN